MNCFTPGMLGIRKSAGVDATKDESVSKAYERKPVSNGWWFAESSSGLF